MVSAVGGLFLVALGLALSLAFVNWRRMQVTGAVEREEAALLQQWRARTTSLRAILSELNQKMGSGAVPPNAVLGAAPDRD
jgi:hypothetical protein